MEVVDAREESLTSLEDRERGIPASDQAAQITPSEVSQGCRSRNVDSPRSGRNVSPL